MLIDFFLYGPIPASFRVYSLLSFLQHWLQLKVDDHWAFPHHVDKACLRFNAHRITILFVSMKFFFSDKWPKLPSFNDFDHRSHSDFVPASKPEPETTLGSFRKLFKSASKMSAKIFVKKMTNEGTTKPSIVRLSGKVSTETGLGIDSRRFFIIK